MKLITLNTWGGRVDGPLKTFFDHYCKEVDIFCLQEIFHDKKRSFANAKGVPGWRENLFYEISDLLEGYQGFFRPFVHNAFGLASFVKSDIHLLEEGDVFVYKEREHVPHIDDSANHGRNIQFLKLKHKGKLFTIINFHGLWNGKGKTDTEDRLNQSRRIVEFAKTISGPKILCGDFNLLPDTESIKILENMGMRNLVKEYAVTNTRTPLYPRAHISSTYADYILVTSGIQVNDFRVLKDVVSDHAPLFIDFEVV
jgi:endonuclease/exonuclease/phosphatase family metal-dependent hydrolase